MPEISAETLHSIKKDISTAVLDEETTITLPYLSHKYGLTFLDSSELLQQWSEGNSSKIAKSFLAQYSDDDGHFHVSLMSEKRLAQIKLQQKVVQTLYSIQPVSTNNQTDIAYCESYENVQIKLATDNPSKRVHIYRAALGEKSQVVKHEKITAAKTKAINNIFNKAESSTSSKRDAENDEKNKIEEKKKSPVKPKTPEKKKTSPNKASPKKTSKGGSIASFFGKGCASKPIQEKPNKQETVEKVEEKPEVKVKESMKTEKDVKASTSKPTLKPIDESKKRPAIESDDEVVPNTPKEKRNTKGRTSKKFKPAPKKSRIIQIADSSDSDSEVETPKKEIEFEEDDINLKVSSPEKSPPKQEEKKTRKGRRAVNKTYMDPDGFVVTKREVEEYSLSEEEEGEKAPDVKVVKEVKVPTKTKQGNLLSFFTKK